MEIKFRAWDKKEKKMIRSPYDADFNVVIALPNLVQIHSKTKEMGCIIKGDFLNERFVPMLYIGEKDKNGKEIYKDDIVKNKCGQIGKVTFKHGAFVFHWDDNTETYWSSDPNAENDIEVIGNVWENPNLLKGGKDGNQIKNR